MEDLSATDRCVKCGLCLPHCPTFKLTGNEADSPRGRISLMQWLEETPEITPGLLTHIDGCLHCGACESMCPSLVPFGALMDSTRARLVALRKRGIVERAFNCITAKLLASPLGLRFVSPLLSSYRRLGLPVLTGKLPGMVGRINRLLACTQGSRIAGNGGRSEARSPVHLFPGCTGQALDGLTLHDAHTLLHALGFNVAVSRNTACCGALHQHSGHLDKAKLMAELNCAALNDDAPIISIASGCAAHLKNYDVVNTNGSPDSFSSRVSEITAFLAGQNKEGLHFAPCEHPVGVYIPCTQRNALQQSQAVFDVLNWIPQLKIQHVNPQGECCGAAGSYMLTQSEIADALGDTAVEQVIDCGVRTLVTTNIGCSIQLQARLRARGIEVDVVHPVTLLSRQLRETVTLKH